MNNNYDFLIGFLIGTTLGCLVAIFIFQFAYPYMISATIKRIIKQQPSPPRLPNDPDEADSWKPDGWDMKDYYETDE